MSIKPKISQQLKNGLIVECLDQSRKIAADRWFIRVVVRIGIPVDAKWFEGTAVDDMQIEKMRRQLGNDVVFEQVKERNFVSQTEKAAEIEDICSRSVEIAATYCGGKEFAQKYILKKFNQKSA